MTTKLTLNQLVTAAKCLHFASGEAATKKFWVEHLTSNCGCGVDDKVASRVWKTVTASGRVVKNRVVAPDFDFDSESDRQVVANLVLAVLSNIVPETMLLSDLLPSIESITGLPVRFITRALCDLHHSDKLVFNQAVPPAHIIPKW